LSIVVPLFNEEESVAALMQAICQALQTFSTDGPEPVAAETQPPILELRGPVRCEVILVDDGSSDNTVAAAVEASADTDIPVRVISLRRNFGQTAAMQAGIDASRGALIATLDGDLQNDPADIPRMVEHLQANGLDLLVGRRKRRQDGLFLRLIPSWIANRLIARVTGVNIHDYGCSLKIYRTSVIRQVKLMGEMHRFIPAWIASVTHPSRIGEIEVNHRARQFGSSKYGISRTIRVVLDLISVLFFMKFRARPGHFFGTVGMVVGMIGAAMLSTVLVSKYALGQDIGTRPMLLMGAFAMLSSLQLVCFGVMTELLSRIYYDSSRRSTYVARQTYANCDQTRQQSIPSPAPNHSTRKAA
jgi:glycosyltransferase involved in cell wall biosynthesis